MATHSAVARVAYFLLVVAAVGVIIVAAQKAVKVQCDSKKACFPFNPRGPFCARGNNINLRFMVNVAEENYRLDTSTGLNVTSITYAFCPVVDEFQAFKLSNATRWAVVQRFTTTSEEDGSLLINYKIAPSVKATYIQVYGLGDSTNYFFPNETTSYGAVMLIDNVTASCPEGSVGVVDFLSLNLTMSDGHYKYYADFQMPSGGGFAPTCDEYDICKFNGSKKCFGLPGMRNCGSCMSDATEIMNTPVLIWTSYYGTDVYGRRYSSGAGNPMNFRKFSGGSVAASMSQSYKAIEDGNTVSASDLGP